MNSLGIRSAQSLLVPGAAIVPAIMSEQAAQKLGEEIDRGIFAIAADLDVSTGTVDRLCTTWDQKSGFVERAVEEMAPILKATLAELKEFGDETYVASEGSVFIGSSEQASGTHAHQDIAYRWNRPDDRYAVTTWLALDAFDEGSGALTFCPSVSSAIVESRQDFLHPSFADLATSDDWRSNQVVAAVSPGDMVTFRSTVWHASSGFKQRGRRRALVIRWKSLSGWEQKLSIPEPPTTTTEFGMDVSGKLLCQGIQNMFADAPTSCKDEALRKCIDWLLNRSDWDQHLEKHVIEDLNELAIALRIAESYGGRPSAEVWRNTRDNILPALREPIAGSGRT